MSDHEVNEAIVAEFRANGGRVGGMFEGAPLLLITTQGARSGRMHTTPVAYHAEGDRWLIFGTNAGRPKNPDWYHNLRRDPQTTVEIGEQDAVVTYHALATVLDEPERTAAYSAQSDRDPAFRAYQEHLERTVPVVALQRFRFSPDAARNLAVGEQLRNHHAGLRAELNRVRDGLADVREDGSGRVTLSRDLLVHCLGFCDALRMHHRREDGVLTEVQRLLPEAHDTVRRIREEHHVVGASLDRIQQLSDRLAETTREPDRAELVQEIERLADQMEAHFDYEEEQLLPALGRIGDRAVSPSPET